MLRLPGTGTSKADLIDRMDARFGVFDGKIDALSEDFKNFKGTVYSFGIGMTIVIPFVTWALMKFLK